MKTITPDLEYQLKHLYYKEECSEFLHHIYHTGRELFDATYKKMLSKQEISVFFLDAVKQYNGSNNIPDFEKILMQKLDENDYFTEKTIYIIENDLQDKNVFKHSNLHSRSNILIAAGCFYDSNELIKQLFNQLFRNTLQNTDHENFTYVLDNLLVGQVQYKKRNPSHFLEHLLQEQIITPQMLFMAYSHNLLWTDSLHINAQVVKPFVHTYRNEALQLLLELQSAKEYELPLRWMKMIYNMAGLTDVAPLTGYLESQHAILRKNALKIISRHEAELFENNKDNTVLKNLVQEWQKEQQTFESERQVIDFCRANSSKKGMALLKWIPGNIFHSIQFKSGQSGEEVLSYLLSAYFQLDEPKRIVHIDRIVEWLKPGMLAAALQHVFQLWRDEKNNPKYKMLVIPYAIYGPDNALDTLNEQIPLLFKSSRSAIASLMIKAIAMNGSDKAVTIVGNMAAYKEWTASWEAFPELAAQRNTSVDVLGDMIVPDLGFDSHALKTIWYKSGLLTIGLDSAFNLFLQDQDGKPAKNVSAAMPKAAKADMEQAKKDVSELNKQLSEIIRAQEARLMKVFINGRKWSYDEWEKIFRRHPLMRNFTDKLLWAIYEGDSFVNSVVCTASGFVSWPDEQITKIDRELMIGLCHPADTDQYTIHEWYRQLPDNKYTDNIRHLAMLPVSALQRDEITSHCITRYAFNMISKDMDVVQYIDDTYHNSVAFWDVHGIYFRDEHLDIEAQLRCSRQAHLLEDTLFRELVFYRSSERRQYEYEQMTEVSLSDPEKLPQRFVTTVLAMCDDLMRNAPAFVV